MTIDKKGPIKGLVPAGGIAAATNNINDIRARAVEQSHSSPQRLAMRNVQAVSDPRSYR